jgi:hypothetical protein
MIDGKKLVELSGYFTIIHQTKGRVRVRVDSKIKQREEKVTLKDIENLPKKISGIKSIKLNMIVGSITIEYDNQIFPDSLWVDLVEGKNSEYLVEMINKLIKEKI